MLSVWTTRDESIYPIPLSEPLVHETLNSDALKSVAALPNRGLFAVAAPRPQGLFQHCCAGVMPLTYQPFSFVAIQAVGLA